MSSESVMPFNHFILCHPLLLLPSIIPRIRVFSNESSPHIRWPKYWSFSISHFNKEGLLPLGLTGLISLQSKGFSRVFFTATIWKHQFFHVQRSLCSNSHIYRWLLDKPQLWLYKPLSTKCCLCFLICCSRFVTGFLLRSMYLLISWLQSPSIVISEPKKINSVTLSTFPPSICHEVMGLDVMILVFWMLSFKTAFSICPFAVIKRLFRSSLFSAITVASSAYLRLLIPSPESWFQLVIYPTWMYFAYKLNKASYS